MIYKINIDSVYCLGDIHGSLKSIAGHIKRYDLKNCALIFCGDIGFGFEKTEYFKQIYRKLHPLLSPNNIYCYFVRGNHDNPDLFNGKRYLTNVLLLLSISSIRVCDRGKDSLSYRAPSLIQYFYHLFCYRRIHNPYCIIIFCVITKIVYTTVPNNGFINNCSMKR